MARNVAIGIQQFDKLIEKDCFYVDKTDFIREWWESGDDVTLITRPRRFGKTLNMSMTEQFFSIDYADRGDLFEGLSVWEDEKYREIQGTYPVISLSFANVKEKDYRTTRKKICQLLTNLYAKHSFLLDSGLLYESDVAYFKRVSENMDELVSFTRSMFNSAFKTNPWLERAIMTGITRVSRESMFSDLNNLEVVITTSDKYATSFGFTEEEVFAALDECGRSDQKQQVKQWYDGFIFGEHPDIYNPWSILNFLDKGVFTTYWANTSSNSLVGKLLREGNRRIKEKFEILLRGESIQSVIDEQIVYSQLDGNERAVWSLLLASGYLKVVSFESYRDIPEGTNPKYELALTNLEVRLMFGNMIRDWFAAAEADYNDFIKALLLGDVKAMNAYMNRVSLDVFSYFDTGNRPSGEEPERFYHGFVLGLIVDLQGRYVITSNRESGFGRYDVVLEPKDPKADDAIILEFKVHDPEDEATLKETVQAALSQIEEKQYAKALTARGIPSERIRSYGFAFEGKKVLIG